MKKLPPLVSLARELIDIASVSGEEYEVAVHIESLLQQLGFVVQRQEISERRFNLLATTGETPRVLFCTHLDTVPPFFPSREEGAQLFGRGACDTKGILAAMLHAAAELLSDGVKEFGFLLVVAEETDSIGAKRANEQYGGLGSQFVIVGEPTESKFVRASKGALTCRIEFRGVAAHSAYPERGDSAILKLMRAVERISSADWGSDPLLGAGTANVGTVRGGARANIIPAHAEAELIFRTAGPIVEVRAKLAQLIADLDGEITYSAGNDPLHMLVPAGEEFQVVAFNTDAPHLSKLGRPLLFGPGSILDAHSADEKISIDEMSAAVTTYRDLVRDLLSGELEFHGQS